MTEETTLSENFNEELVMIPRSTLNELEDLRKQVNFLNVCMRQATGILFTMSHLDPRIDEAASWLLKDYAEYKN